MARGSGLTGLGAMAKVTPLDAILSARRRRRRDCCSCVRCSTFRRRGWSRRSARERIAFADDPSNRDPRFTRVALRDLMPALAREGLDARRLALLARRLRRAEAAIEMAVAVAAAARRERAVAGARSDRLRCRKIPPSARRSGAAPPGAGDRARRRRGAGRTRQARSAARGDGGRCGEAGDLSPAPHAGGGAGHARPGPAGGRARPAAHAKDA